MPRSTPVRDVTARQQRAPRKAGPRTSLSGTRYVLKAWLDSGSDAAGTTAALPTRDRNTLRTDSRRPRDRRTAVPRRPRQPYPQQPYGGGGPGAGGSPWPQPHGGGHGEPEYFGDGGYPQGGHHGGQAPHDPYAANNPGHTQAFTVGDDPYNQGETYRAGPAPPPGPVGPRLHWKALLRGVVVAPNQTLPPDAGLRDVGPGAHRDLPLRPAGGLRLRRRARGGDQRHPSRTRSRSS